MADAIDRTYEIGVHPGHAALLAAALPLLFGGLLSDLAYHSSYEIQWSNFAAWLIAAAMVFVGLALLWVVIDVVRRRSRGGRQLIYVLVLIALLVLGLINSFVHARDAWAVMPDGLILSAIVSLLGLVALWLGFWGIRSGAAR